ncbi:hypothetical protein FGRA07_08289 [Fusarium graminearum]|nr:hypothetical protein FGRA07_08289 [Fusarium graminearum]
MDAATITRLAFDSDLKTRDTLNLLANHDVLLRLNRSIIKRKLAGINDDVNKAGVSQTGQVGSSLSTIALASKTQGVHPRGCAMNVEWEQFVLDWSQAVTPRQLYLSAGIGITPILAMMKAHANHPNMNVAPGIWIHVVKDGRGLQFHSEFCKIENNPIRRFVFMTQPRDIDVRGRDYDVLGRPSLDSMAELLGETYKFNPFGTTAMDLPSKFSAAYICGPKDFEATMKSLLLSCNIPPPFIHSESFSASGHTIGDVEKATVRFAKSGKTAHWKKDESMSLLELAESVGMAPDYGCRVGACGSCVAKVACGSVSGGLQMDGCILTCSAVPTSEFIEVEL